MFNEVAQLRKKVHELDQNLDLLDTGLCEHGRWLRILSERIDTQLLTRQEWSIEMNQTIKIRLKTYDHVEDILTVLARNGYRTWLETDIADKNHGYYDICFEYCMPSKIPQCQFDHPAPI